MDWASEKLYGKARLYAQRAHSEDFASPLFGFWMSLSLELLARAALANIHPVLLADPTGEDNIHYVFGITPKKPPKSVAAKAVFARCAVHVAGFTDQMSVHCLIMADRRNAELHSGLAAFEGQDNSTWLPATYEVMDVLLKHLKSDFRDFLGKAHETAASRMLEDRNENRKKEILNRISSCRKHAEGLGAEALADKRLKAEQRINPALSGARKSCECPACRSTAIKTGEIVGRSPVRIDEDKATITRDVRILPNQFRCLVCDLRLHGYPEMKEAGLGAVYNLTEEEDPIEFFGIVPEEHVDIDQLIASRYEDDYHNE